MQLPETKVDLEVQDSRGEQMGVSYEAIKNNTTLSQYLDEEESQDI